MESRMNVRLIIVFPMTALVFFTICYFYSGNYSRKVFTLEKHLPPTVYKLDTDNDIHKIGSMSDSHLSNTQYKNGISSTSLEHDWIKKMEEKYRKDNERIRKICDEHKETLSFDINTDINSYLKQQIRMFDVKHRLAYCPIEKVKCLFLPTEPGYMKTIFRSGWKVP